MDVLTNKQTKTYDHISRYSSFPFYYNTKDKKYIYGTTGQLSQDVEYVAYNVVQGDTLDSLSLKYYGRPDLYWVIADFNRIQDPLEKLPSIVNIPTLSNISFE
jgi:nucleoid-associated protein YgaU